MKFYRLSSKGVALPTVIMVMLVGVTIATMLLAMTTSQARTGVTYEDNISALHSAEAGLNEYLWYLNKENAELDFETVTNYPKADPVAAYFIEELESTNMQKTVKVTGWTLRNPDIKRTIEATFKQRSFTEYVYFSDNDPADIWWQSGEKCFGPYHTNTSLRISGSPEFFGAVSYVEGIEYSGSATNDPKFYAGTQQVEPIGYPSNNSELKAHAEADGYVYTGRTSIMLNSDGTITVWNPSSNSNKVTRPLPPNGVIYVDGTATNETTKTNPGPTDQQLRDAAAKRFNQDLGNVFISGTLKGRLTVGAKNDIYITDYDPTYGKDTEAASHETNGIHYASTDFEVDTVTGEIRVTGTGQEDMLGLIADNNVAVLTYGWFNNSGAKMATTGIQVYGAVFAINGSFGNSYNIFKEQDNTWNPTNSFPSPGGKLTVRGAIIQRKRGIVGIGTGFTKDYAHDIRMLYESPPYFLAPVDSGWAINTWKEK